MVFYAGTGFFYELINMRNVLIDMHTVNVYKFTGKAKSNKFSV